MGYREIVNQLKGMKPLAQAQVKKLSQVAKAPIILPNPINSMSTMSRTSDQSKQVAKDEKNNGIPYKAGSLRPVNITPKKAVYGPMGPAKMPVRTNMIKIQAKVNAWKPQPTPAMKKKMPR